MPSTVSSIDRPSAAALDAGRAALVDALGADRVATGADHLLQHGTDESFLPPVPPDLVVWPRSVEEAVAIVRVAITHRLPLIPFGSGTSLEGQIAALSGGISVDTRELKAISPPSLEDLDVTVQAGVTRDELEARLLPEGVFFSVDPGGDSTIGGMVATGASGTTTVRYGTMRHNVLGLTLVDGNGEVVHTGTRARKSAAGYDLTRLMVGSEGTLGLICEATLRIQPTPEAVVAAICNFPTVEDAVQCSVALGHNSIHVARVEFLDESTIQAVNTHSQLSLTAAPTLLLEFHGRSAEDVESQARDAGQIVAEFGGGEFKWAADEAERRHLWDARHAAMEALKSLRPGSVVFPTDVCVPVSELAAAISAARADIGSSGLIATLAGHVGDGNFHAGVLIEPGNAAELAQAEAFHARMIERALAVGGTCTGEHGIGYGKAQYLEQEHGATGVKMMQAVKQALDPHGIFNPGKGVMAQIGG